MGEVITKSNSYQRSVSIHIDLNAIEHNFAIAKRESGGQRCFAVVKADAYGHGLVPVAKALPLADGFAVVTMGEAIALRESGITKPILVLQGPQQQSDCADVAHFNLLPVIHCLAQLDWFAHAALAEPVSAWLEIDTGMGRLGVTMDEAAGLLSTNCSALKWVGLMSHFACADNPENAHTVHQIEAFRTISNAFDIPASLANSAGILAWPESKADWARPGIMLYGCNPLLPPYTKHAQLRPAMQVSAPLIAAKWLAAGSGIGYGQSYQCLQRLRVGYAAIGYGDGLPRVLDREASVRIGNSICAIIGRVSMDSIAIDLTTTPDARAGEKVVLWGPEHPVEKLAQSAGTISYQLLTQIKGERTYLDSTT